MLSRINALLGLGGVSRPRWSARSPLAPSAVQVFPEISVTSMPQSLLSALVKRYFAAFVTASCPSSCEGVCASGKQSAQSAVSRGHGLAKSRLVSRGGGLGARVIPAPPSLRGRPVLSMEEFEDPGGSRGLCYGLAEVPLLRASRGGWSSLCYPVMTVMTSGTERTGFQGSPDVSRLICLGPQIQRWTNCQVVVSI